MSLGIKSSAFLRVFTMGSWIHDGFLDSRWVLRFTMGSWVHDKVHVKSLDFFEPCTNAAKEVFLFEAFLSMEQINRKDSKWCQAVLSY